MKSVIYVGLINKRIKGKKLGTFPKEKFDGDFIKDWNKSIDQAGFDKIDASAFIATALAVKDDQEINCIKKACDITNKIFGKYLKDQIINIIDGEKVTIFRLFFIHYL